MMLGSQEIWISLWQTIAQLCPMNSTGGGQYPRLQGRVLGGQAKTNVRPKEDGHPFTSTPRAATFSSGKVVPGRPHLPRHPQILLYVKKTLHCM